MVKVSVIVPIYNVEKYLRQCLDSLVDQTLEEIEILAINDGSPDESQKIIDEYVEKYDKIKSFIKENGGQSDARNYGVKKALGEYIMFVDGDDWIAKDALEKMYNKAKENDSDIVICDIEENYENGLKIVRNEINLEVEDIQKAYMIAMPGFCDKLFRREFLIDIDFKFPNGIFYEDLAVYPAVAAKTNKVSYVNIALYKYRIRMGSTMNQEKNSKRLKDIFEVFDYIENGMTKEDKEKFKNEIEYIYIEHLLHTASLRFLDYKEEDINIAKISDIIKEKYPSWRKNKYYRKENFKYKIVCNLIYLKKLNLLRKILGR